MPTPPEPIGGPEGPSNLAMFLASRSWWLLAAAVLAVVVVFVLRAKPQS